MSYAHRVFNASDGLPNAGAYEAAKEADETIQRLRTQLAESEAACAAYRAALEKADQLGVSIRDLARVAQEAAALERREDVVDKVGEIIGQGKKVYLIARQALESNPGKAVGDVIAAAKRFRWEDIFLPYLLRDDHHPKVVAEFREFIAALAKLEGRE